MKAGVCARRGPSRSTQDARGRRSRGTPVPTPLPRTLSAAMLRFSVKSTPTGISATIGMFARQWAAHVNKVVVVDDHIIGVLSEHQAGRLLGVRPTGISIRGRRSTPGRYFQVADPGTGWAGTDITDPPGILGPFKPNVAWPEPAGIGPRVAGGCRADRRTFTAARLRRSPVSGRGGARHAATWSDTVCELVLARSCPLGGCWPQRSDGTDGSTGTCMMSRFARVRHCSRKSRRTRAAPLRWRSPTGDGRCPGLAG